MGAAGEARRGRRRRRRLYEELACPAKGACWGVFDLEHDSNGVPIPGALRPPAVVPLARPFPRAAPGTYTSFSFDRGTRVFTLHSDGTSGTFERAAPRLVYPYDVQVLCDGSPAPTARVGGAVRFDCGGRVIEMHPAGEPAGATVPFADAFAAVQGSHDWSPQ